MMDAYRAPFPDYWSRLGDARRPARHPVHRARPQRGADGLDPRAPATDLDVPVTLVWGMRDRVFQPVFMEQWRELFPDARGGRAEDAAHYVPEDQPDAVIERSGLRRGRR